jgi:hypothetical protein
MTASADALSLAGNAGAGTIPIFIQNKKFVKPTPVSAHLARLLLYNEFTNSRKGADDD